MELEDLTNNGKKALKYAGMAATATVAISRIFRRNYEELPARISKHPHLKGVDLAIKCAMIPFATAYGVWISAIGFSAVRGTDLVTKCLDTVGAENASDLKLATVTGAGILTTQVASNIYESVRAKRMYNETKASSTP